MTSLPDYKNIPPVEGMPHGCTWGMWDKDGVKDQLGTLNLLTPEVVKRAKQEVEHGISVAVNWSLDNCTQPLGTRRRLGHTIIAKDSDETCFDDELHFNTQTSSQWDGFRHWAHQPTRLFYNGVTPEDIEKPTGAIRNGIEQWTKRGGLVGRGILLDYLAWAQKQGIEYSPVESHRISIKDLEAVAKDQGVEFQPADILLVRTGFIKWHTAASEELRLASVRHRGTFAGVEGTEETVEWLWNHHFAAVGGDAVTFETWPAPDPKFRLHDNMIALFGTPLGEMFDLERLAEECRKVNKWSFLFTSAPLNVVGGVASPPNAICVL